MARQLAMELILGKDKKDAAPDLTKNNNRKRGRALGKIKKRVEQNWMV